jgi:hypothetical protein
MAEFTAQLKAAGRHAEEVLQAADTTERPKPPSGAGRRARIRAAWRGE